MPFLRFARGPHRAPVRTRRALIVACAPVLPLLPFSPALATVLTVETSPEGNSPYIVNKNETHTGFVVGYITTGLVNDVSGDNLSLYDGVYVGNSPYTGKTGTWSMHNNAGFSTSVLYLGGGGQVGIFRTDEDANTSTPWTGTINATNLTLGTNAGNSFTQSSGLIVGSSTTLNGGTFTLSGGIFRSTTFEAYSGSKVVLTGGTFSGLISLNSTLTVSGGTLLTGSNPNFILPSAAGVINVGAGGMTVDTSTHSSAIGLPLNHDPATSGLDGGITKLGAGTLTLKYTPNTTGPATVNAGTIAFNAFGTTLSRGINFNGGNANFALPAAATLSGSYNFNATAQLGNYGSPVTFTGDITTANSPALTIDTFNQPVVFAGGISGSGFSQVNVNAGSYFNLAASSLGTAPVNLKLASTFTLFNSPTVAGTITMTVASGVPTNIAYGSTSGGATISGPIVFSGPAGSFGNFSVASGGNLTLTGGISGAPGLSTSGPGNLVITKPSTYTGPTLINAGTITATTTTTTTVAGAFTGGTNVTVNSGGTLSLNGHDNSLGYNAGLPNLFITGGTLFAAAGTYHNIGNLSLTGGTMSGGNGSGFILDQTLKSLASSSLSTINAGPSIVLRNDGGVNGVGGTFDVAKGTTPSGVDLSVIAGISGQSASDKLTKSGAGYLQLSGTNTYTGGTILSAGTLEIASNSAIPTAGTVTINGGTIRAGGSTRSLTNPIVLAGNFTLGRLTNFVGSSTLTTNVTLSLDNPDAPANNDSVVYNISGPYGLTVASGSLYGAGTGFLSLAGNNSFTGPLTVNTNVRIGNSATADLGVQSNITVNSPGLLRYVANNVVKNTSAVTVNAGGTLDLANFGDTIGTLNGAGSVINVGTVGLKLVAPAGTFTGSISGAGSFIIDGSASGGGPYTLGGNNSYAGGTGVYRALVYVGSTTAIPTAAQVEINSGTLNLNGFNTTLTSLTGTGGALDLGNATATVNTPSNTTFAGDLTGFGSLIKTGAGSWTISGGAPTGAIVVNQGTLTINNSFRIPAATVFTSAGNVVFNSSQYLDSLLVNFGTKATLTAGGSKTLNTNSLTLFNNGSFSGGTLDLNDNDLKVDYTGSTSPLSTISDYIRYAYNNGAWNTPGLTSSAAAADPKHITALGYGENSLIGLPGTDTATVFVKYTYYGDANLDGKVNADDYALLDRSFAKHLSTAAHWTDGDFNYDLQINSADYLLIDRAYAQQGGALSPELLSQRESQFGSAYVSDLLTSIPEPSSLLELFGVIFVGRRKRI